MTGLPSLLGHPPLQVVATADVNGKPGLGAVGGPGGRHGMHCRGITTSEISATSVNTTNQEKYPFKRVTVPPSSTLPCCIPPEHLPRDAATAVAGIDGVDDAGNSPVPPTPSPVIDPVLAWKQYVLRFAETAIAYFPEFGELLHAVPCEAGGGSAV